MGFGWTAIVSAALAWNLYLYRSETVEIARNVARTHVDKDLLFRKWNSLHGGVYVPITEKTRPNPYLHYEMQREITASDGKIYTLINPAYMSRELFELGIEKQKHSAHVTSLNPLRPENLADPWEAQALKTFEKGAKEISSVAILNGIEQMRLMIPLPTEQECLKCHADQGYVLGDVRGGLSIALPMDQFWDAKAKTIRNIWVGHILFWLMGLLGVGLNFISLHRRFLDRKKAEETLRFSEARYRELFDRMGSGVAVYEARNNGEDFVIVDFNKAAEVLEKIEKRELLGRNVAEVFPGIKEFGLFEILQRVWATGNPEFMDSHQYRDERISGWRENFVYKLPSGEVVAIYRDVTHVKMIEENLRHAQKMEAIGTLAGGVAHDFNNILTAIIGYAELSLVATPKGSPVYQHIEKIVISGKRASELVKQILTFSRQTGHEKRGMLLQLVLKETVKLLRGTLPTTIDIRQEIDVHCGPVLADITQIHQIIMNLGTNAFHAMRDKQNGILEISLTEVVVDAVKASKYPGVRAGKYARLMVKDTGHGMNKEVLNRIFEPYFTTKKQGEGTGLGLATVHGIVKNHQGFLEVESSPGQGSTFTIYLPIIESLNVAKKEPDVGNILEYTKTTGNVLFVDDEETIVQLADKILRLLGCEVTTFMSSIEAMEAFTSAPMAFDLIITDQTMPGITGFELARRMLAIRPDIPIILCTGFSENVNETTAKEIGISEFMMKPLTIYSLSEAVNKYLQYVKQ